MIKYSFILLLFFTLPGYAQSVFTGIVKNKEGEPIPATITIQSQGSTTISGFATTDRFGKYEVTYKGTGDSLIIIARGLMLEKIIRRVPNRSATVNFIVEEKVNQLAEVKVMASPVRRKGDTLTYTVNAFLGQSDRTIEDVMKKMPGIDVSSSGSISYNGKKINKFYIEDADLLGGRYNVATKNITAKDVASVQVFENHQPIKAETTFSDQAAINLKLKDSAKGIWTVTALAGAGYKPALWNAELMAMHFAKNRQHISVYKGNNSGHTANEELKKQYDSGATIPSIGSMLSVSEPATPAFASKRYLKNVTNSVSVNQLFKIKDKELTANVTYYNERLHKNGYSSFTQYLPDDSTPLIVEESMKNISETNDLDVSFGMLLNNENDYLNNILNIKTVWSNSHTEVFSRSNQQAGDETISQYLDRPYFSVSNMLNALKRVGRQMFRIRFLLNYNDKPHHLFVSPANYFGNDSLVSLNQEVILKNFDATLKGTYGLKLGNFTLDYSPRVSANLRKLDSELTGTYSQARFVPAIDSMKNDLWFNNYQVGVDQDYTFNKNSRTKISLTIPAFLSIITTDNCLHDSKVSYKRWIVNPTLYASYNFSPAFSASVNAFYRKTYGNLSDVYTGYIMQSYRNLLRNSADRLFENSSAGSGFSLEYRDAVRMFFINLRGKYQKSRKNLFYGYNYEGIVGVKTFIDQPTDMNVYNLHVSANKTFRFWQTKAGLSAGFSKSNNELLLQNKIEQYYSKDYLVGISLNTTPCKYINFVYDLSWSRSEQSVDNPSEQYPALLNHSHDFKVWIFPNDVLSINFNVDYQYYNETNNRNMAFADALVRYKYKQTEWELECNNLFNAKRYVSTTYSEMSTYINQYELRPLSFLLKVRFKLK